MFVAVSATRWPAVPVKVSLPFWPGVVIETGTTAPPTVIAPVRSGATLRSRTFVVPVAVASGSTTTV